eukprot:gnl/Chilomastix_cuspidata/5450.p1 GENE.gnl/Chilomastix_cuspidata/5450~~gnl/Chilomastix_cuspidata/5450.p1  ORF type:complete len:384 (+),score=-1.92 gnl/Chilomastix_cuspidata/5450:40-1152(+)
MSFKSRAFNWSPKRGMAHNQHSASCAYTFGQSTSNFFSVTNCNSHAPTSQHEHTFHQHPQVGIHALQRSSTDSSREHNAFYNTRSKTQALNISKPFWEAPEDASHSHPPLYADSSFSTASVNQNSVQNPQHSTRSKPRPVAHTPRRLYSEDAWAPRHSTIRSKDKPTITSRSKNFQTSRSPGFIDCFRIPGRDSADSAVEQVTSFIWLAFHTKLVEVSARVSDVEALVHAKGLAIENLTAVLGADPRFDVHMAGPAHIPFCKLSETGKIISPNGAEEPSPDSQLALYQTTKFSSFLKSFKKCSDALNPSFPEISASRSSSVGANDTQTSSSNENSLRIDASLPFSPPFPRLVAVPRETVPPDACARADNK